MSCPAVIDVLVPSGPAVADVVTPGPPGPIGSKWITGSGVPGSGVGAVGDFYLRENGDVYGPKTSGGWGDVRFTLTGSTNLGSTNLGIANRTATGLKITSDTGDDADVPLATTTLAGLQEPSNRAKAEGAVQSVALSLPSGWSASSSNTGGNVMLTLSLPTGYSLPSNTDQANWSTAYTERLRWDGGAAGLNAATGRASLGLAAVASSGAYGDLSGLPTTDAVPEGSVNLYFSTARGQSAASSWWSDYRSTIGDQLATAASQAAARGTIGAGTSNVGISNSVPQPLGSTAAAGSTGQAADAGHVHTRSTYADLGPVADGIVFTISNRGETATPSTNYDESLPLSIAVTITKITYITHIDNTGSSTTTLSAYKRTAAGVKTSLLSANATLAAGASITTGSLAGTAGVLSLAAGDRLGVDLIGLGTGASGIKCIIEYTRSAVT